MGRVMEGREGVVIATTRPPLDNLSDDVRVVWTDKRLRSNEQIRKAWALLTEISDWSGDDKEALASAMKGRFVQEYFKALNDRYWGLSNATVSEAKAYIDMLIEVVVEYGIPTKRPLVEYCEDINKYVYACLMNKRCAVCGKPGELHHVEAVGRRDRKTINHLEMECLPLCREHHTESHTIGQTEFMERYHLIPVRIDERIAKKYKLNTKEGKG